MTHASQGQMFAPNGQQPTQQVQQPAQVQQSVAVAQKDVVDNVLAKITKFEETGELVLPSSYSAANALKSAWLILQETVDRNNKPVLETCSKESIANALLDMVVQGLSPVKKQCYFIAYGAKLQLMRSYLGTLAVAKRVAGVKVAAANCVYEGDKFVYNIDPATGLKRIVEHSQSLDNLDVNKVKGAYAILGMEDGRIVVEIMNINQIKQAWMQGATKGSSPAHKNFSDEMAKKTVIGRACKLLIGMSDDAALFDEPDDTERDTIAEQRNEQLTDNANKKKLGNIEDAKFEEVKNTTDGGRQNTSTVQPTPAPASVQPETKVSQPINDPY
jgi:recombination protein RecT